MAVVTVISGAQVVVIQPGLVQAYVDVRGMDASTAGLTLSLEMWGFTATTIALMWLAQRLPWHAMLWAATAAMIGGNVASMAVDGAGFMAARLFAGLGAGVVVSLGFATIGRLPNPDRYFGIMVAFVLVYGAIALALLPTLLQIAGFAGLAGFLAVLPIVVAGCVHGLPAAADVSGISGRGERMSFPQLSALAAMLLYFVAQGSAWAYMSLIGTSLELSESDVANALALSQFPGIAGALLAAWAGDRFGSLLPLAIGIIGGVVAVVLLVGPAAAELFTFAACLFNACWNMTHPYLLGVMARLDRRGLVVVRATAMQKIGLALGPLLASQLITSTDLSGAVWLAAVAMSVALGLIALSLSRRASGEISNPSTT